MLKMLLESIARGKKPARLLCLVLLGTAAAVGVCATAPDPKTPPGFPIVSTGNRLGQLGPCGCAVNPQGGLGRLFQWRESRWQQSSRPALWVDSGNNLFSLSAMNPQLERQWKAQALVMADAYRALGVQYMLPGAKDWTGGAEFLKSWLERAGVRAIATNLAAPPKTAAFWSEWASVPIDGQNWVVAAVLAGEGLPQGWQAENPATALQSVLERTRQLPQRRVLVLSTLPLADNRKLAEALHPDWILASTDDKSDVVERVGTTSVFHHAREAQSVLSLSANGLSEDTPLVAAWNSKSKLARVWDRRVAELNKNKTKAAIHAPGSVTKKGAHYVANPYLCKQCHLPQHQFWEKTQHASAYLVLYAKDQHFDPECVGCHSLGYSEAAGFTSIADPLVLKNTPRRKAGEKPILETILEETFVDEKTKIALDSRKDPDRYASLKAKFHTSLDRRAAQPGWEKVYAGVQCEHCHGNRADHVQSNKKSVMNSVPVAVGACLQCHTDQRDPGFSFAKKLPLIACPRIAR